MKNKKSIISILIVISILATCFINTYAADNDKLVIELKVGSTIGKTNGTASKVEKPYVTNNTIMVPLSWVATAIGAEVNQKANKKIEIIYAEMNAELVIDNKSYTANSTTYKLTVAPKVINGRTMVPLEFITKNFPVSVTSDIKKGNIKIVLNDDGALSDLSFLTGGISSPKLGNSYYGWSISIPSGSRIILNSYKSDKIGITNESRSLYFEICVERKKDKTLSELYNDVLYSNDIRESKIDLKADIPYFQYTRLTEYDESLRVKVFEKGEYYYYVTINSYDSAVTPEKLMSDKYYDNIINSFSLSYKGNVKGVEDVSKVRDGEVSFYNYVSLNSDNKYLPWTLNIPVKWEQVLSSSDPLTTNLGLDSQHYAKITISTLEEETLDEYVESIKNNYNKYFNPKAYTFISSSLINIADTEAQNLKFTIKQADKVYMIDELYFIKNGFVYEISIKLPESEYEKSKAQYIDTISKMKFYTIDEAKYQKDLEKYNSKNVEVRVAPQDEAFDYLNKTYNWSAKIPGYWTKYSSSYDNSTNFQNPNTGASVMVNAVENTSLSKTLSDEEKFSIMQMLKTVYKVTPTQSTKSDKGYQIRTYTYKVEDQDTDFYANVTCYCFESGKNSYCYTSFIPDLTATEEAVKEINNIWNSFKIII